MIKSLGRIITIPIVYCYLIVMFILKWTICAPLVFSLHLLKYTIAAIIIGLIAGIFLTPIVTMIICILALIGALPSVIEDMSYGFFGRWYINWDYARDIFDDNNKANLEKKRKKYIKMANKNYKKSSNEFEGFDRIADIYSK